eukprot:3223683-Amphidinium_carterae.1
MEVGQCLRQPKLDSCGPHWLINATQGPGGSAAVILHRGKLLSIVSNAKAALRLKQESKCERHCPLSG